MYLYWSFLCKLLLCCKFENRHCKVVICQNRLLRLFSTSDNYGTMQKHVKREVKFFSQQVIDPSFHVFSTALIISVHIHFLLLIRTCQSTSTVALHNAVNIWLNYRIPLESKSPEWTFGLVYLNSSRRMLLLLKSFGSILLIVVEDHEGRIDFPHSQLIVW